MQEEIVIKGAKVHNLKNIDVSIPRNKLTVITGMSGSGKSSLAFDTIYAEGQRRYVESLSSYARQFLGQMDKPDVDYIEGLSPAISIDQKTTSKNPRSTVGTITEIYDYLRLMYAHIGIPYCPECGKPIEKQSTSQIIDKIMSYPDSTRLIILSPVIKGRKGEYKKLFDDIRKNGFVRVKVDGEIKSLDEDIVLKKNNNHSIDIVVDRVVVTQDSRDRIRDSVEIAMKYGHGSVALDLGSNKEDWFNLNNINEKEITLSEKFACNDCDIYFDEITPRMFSFNNPFGACQKCNGLGEVHEFDPDLVIPDKTKSLTEGAIKPWGASRFRNYRWQALKSLAAHFDIDLSIPFENLPEKHKKILLYGTTQKIEYKYESEKWQGQYESTFEGIVNQLSRLYKQTDSEKRQREMEEYMSIRTCPLCNGMRLKKEILAIRINEINIAEFTALSIKDAYDFITNIVISEREHHIADQVIKEIKERLSFLVNVGLNYLSLNRKAGTLSGGESQRIRLATQIGSGLVGVLYILDEPSIGLHQKDNKRLIKALTNLRDLGNTVIVVEHDEETMKAADYIIDIGPAAGRHGGEIVCAAPYRDFIKCSDSKTAAFLNGKNQIEIPEKRRTFPKKDQKYLKVIGAEQNNLNNIDVKIPLKKLVCITGVSGSGKSTLINHILSKEIANRLTRSHNIVGKHKAIEGLDNIDKQIVIDQSPIGRTPRSNPVTYTGVFTDIRQLFASTMEAKLRGYNPGRFSFNVKGGRCEHCQGDGIIKIEMHFLPDVYVPCEVCNGKRYNTETLEVLYKGNSIADVLEMTVNQAIDVFSNISSIKRRLQTIADVGLGYIHLGQSSTTLSGGEAQRIKLATELSKRSTGKTLYILDEPTTGLHFEDVKMLLDVLNRLVNNGNSILVIEHNLDVIKCADHIIDLGPDGGDNGGTIVAEGTPEYVSKVKGSYTGDFLSKILT